jgi:Flp pilus assembly protein TadB
MVFVIECRILECKELNDGFIIFELFFILLITRMTYRRRKMYYQTFDDAMSGIVPSIMRYQA